MVLFIALTALAAWALSFRIESLRRWRRAALFLCLSIALGSGAVALAKATTNRHCPWDMERYGGMVPYTKLFEGEPPGCGRGVCFPAGHASAGFSLMPAYFIFYRTSRRRARAVLAAGAAIGLVFGLSQVARGAHFLSHNLWTAAFCWFIGLVLYTAVFHSRVLPEDQP
jgi:membrane-associated PAP2 superfamily phosphatase